MPMRRYSAYFCSSGSVMYCVVSMLWSFFFPPWFQTNGSTHRGEIRQSGGGVGRNMADALGKLGAHPFLISAVGNDQTGEYLLKSTLKHVVSTTIAFLQVSPVPVNNYAYRHTQKWHLVLKCILIDLEAKPKRENTNECHFTPSTTLVWYLHSVFFMAEYSWEVLQPSGLLQW